MCDGGGEELGLNAGLKLSGGGSGVCHFLLLLGCGLCGLLSGQLNKETGETLKAHLHEQSFIKKINHIG